MQCIRFFYSSALDVLVIIGSDKDMNKNLSGFWRTEVCSRVVQGRCALFKCIEKTQEGRVGKEWYNIYLHDYSLISKNSLIPRKKSFQKCTHFFGLIDMFFLFYFQYKWEE